MSVSNRSEEKEKNWGSSNEDISLDLSPQVRVALFDRNSLLHSNAPTDLVSHEYKKAIYVIKI